MRPRHVYGPPSSKAAEPPPPSPLPVGSRPPAAGRAAPAVSRAAPPAARVFAAGCPRRSNTPPHCHRSTLEAWWTGHAEHYALRAHTRICRLYRCGVHHRPNLKTALVQLICPFRRAAQTPCLPSGLSTTDTTHASTTHPASPHAPRSPWQREAVHLRFVTSRSNPSGPMCDCEEEGGEVCKVKAMGRG